MSRRPRSFRQKCRRQVTAEVGVGWLCCPSIVWEGIRETKSNAVRKGTLVHSRLNSLSQWGLILGQRMNSCARADLWFPLENNNNNKQRQQQQNKQTNKKHTQRRGNDSSKLPPKSSHPRKKQQHKSSRDLGCQEWVKQKHDRHRR